MSPNILISTYNGELFLPKVLESMMLARTFSEFRLVIRDDGSTDATPNILCGFTQQFPERVQLVKDADCQLGPSASFSRLIEASDSSYIMLCDQDDIWLPDKIEKTMAAMREAEKQYGSNTPLLVHTDLKVVDENLLTIADSFWKCQNLSPELGSQLNRLLVQNVVAGCTVMINRALADLAAPIPPAAAMHDWWLALVAVTFGKVIYLDEQTILYRQHGKNSVGAKKWGVQRVIQQALAADRVQQSMVATMIQAQALLDRYADRMLPEQRELIEVYARLPLQPKIARVWNVVRYKFFKHGLVRTVGFLCNLLLMPRYTLLPAKALK